MRKIFFFALGFFATQLFCVACSSENDAVKALTAAGYTNIQTTGHAFFACGKDDTFSTGFTAIGPTGVPVKGAVCSSWFKGSTIRTF